CSLEDGLWGPTPAVSPPSVLSRSRDGRDKSRVSRPVRSSILQEAPPIMIRARRLMTEPTDRTMSPRATVRDVDVESIELDVNRSVDSRLAPRGPLQARGRISSLQAISLDHS